MRPSHTEENQHTDSLVDASWRQWARRRLLNWFEKHARSLPWRAAPLPYYVWVSEIMLQQTQVATVVPYFERFIERFPDVEALANAPEHDVLRMWEGLGYYRRARQLHKAAKLVASEHGGIVPRDADELRALPGIGRYTAGAILSIAFDAREPILEANTIRVFSRLLAYEGDTTTAAGQKLLWSFAEEILPRSRCGAFNQAVMELGSEVCFPKSPNCPKCPLVTLCPTHAAGLAEVIPRAKTKQKFEQVCEAAVVVQKRGQVLLRQCGPGQRWAGLWDFPRFAVASRGEKGLLAELADKVNETTGLTVEPGRRITTIRHGVTKYRITLHCHEAAFVSGRLRRSNGETHRWIAPAKLGEYPLNATGRKIGRLLIDD